MAAALVLTGSITVAVAGGSPESEAKTILEATGTQGGLVVHFGCGDGVLTAALRADDGFLVHGLDADPKNIAEARRHIRSLGLYGEVTVELWGGRSLPYADGLVNLFVAEDLRGLPLEEVLRTLAPNGVAYIRNRGQWTTTRKPRPLEIDEWTHALYDASGNAVSKDTVVAPPHHIQWVGSPRNARHHERLASITVVVSAAGRLYAVVDEAPTASILLPPRWSLVARDAFNGVVLWKRAIPSWEPYLRSFRSGPPEASRRLVARGERVYMTLGQGAPLEALDGATGRTITKYEGTEGTEEILCHEGELLVVLGGGSGQQKAKAPSPAPKSIVAIRTVTGEVLWRKPETTLMPMTLARGAGRVCYLSEDAVVCLEARTGEEIWRTERTVAQKRPGWSVPTVVVREDVILCADRQPDRAPDVDESTGKRIARWLAEGGAPGDLTAYSAQTGEILWTCRCAESFHAPIDVFVNDGLVWVGQSRARQGPDFTVARDLSTGEIKRRISPEKAFQTTMPHHRCHRNRATSRYIVAGRTGVEFIDTRTGDAFRHHWIRGVCQYGVLPANGLLYVPAHSCACYIEAKLAGFYALAPASARATASRPASAAERLERGPAYVKAGSRESGGDSTEDWPTYRHDSARSGSTETVVPRPLSILWQRDIGGRLSGPVIAEGKTFVASVDRHTVHALDARRGTQLWQYTAGGRIDSPPTVARGLAVFGAADGHVHCVRAADGVLAWRFRAAPQDRRVVAFGQLESVWPVHGSVLVNDAVVYCAAGRSSYLDGGIHLYRLDLKTGRKLSEEPIYSRDPATGEQPEEPTMFEMPGALPDVLSTDGELVYMRHLSLDPVTLRRQEPRQHLYSPAGFLNGDWWHRTYWIFGAHFYSGYIGWYFAGRETPAGRLLVTGDKSIYGFSYRPEFYRGSTGRRYQLFAADKKAQPAPEPPDYRRANRDYPPRGEAKFKPKYRWSRGVPLLVRSMVRAGDTLFLAGPPDRALRSPDAFAGKEGGILCTVSGRDGRLLEQYRLDSLPRFDGMAAANGRLYLSTEDGQLLCLGDGDQAPDSRALTPVAAVKRPPPGKAAEPGLAGHWR